MAGLRGGLRPGPHALALLPWGQKHASGRFQQLRLPLRNLLRMHVEFFRQLRQRHVILERRQRDLRFERRHMVPSGSFHPCSLVGRYLRP